MTERYPDDATLLAMSQDEATGVEYIPTGRSPYYLEFRKLVHRLLRAAERANDLRVYQDGDLSVGVRPGRCRIGETSLNHAGATGHAIAADTTTYLWLDDAGSVQSGAALPSDRTTFVPLAEVTAGPAAIDAVTDLRGEALLHIASHTTLGLTATPAEINQALDGIGASVTALALTFLCDGPTSSADALHQHTQMADDTAGTARFLLLNDSADAAANIALRLSLPAALPADTDLLVNRANGFLQQAYDGTAYNLVGSVHVQHLHAGTLTASTTGVLLGAVPIGGVVSDVVLSVGGNIVSSDAADGIAAAVYVNGAALLDTPPALTSADGPGFASTAQGDGTPATVKSDTTEQVQRGDTLTVDLTRTANGAITSEASDVAVMVVIRADQPE